MCNLLISRNKIIIKSALAALALTAGALLLGLPRLQQLRANASLADANTHIEQADSLMSGIDVTEEANVSFSSPDAIKQAHDALAAAGPTLDQAAAEVSQARDEADSASGLSLLPGWYRDYLGKKRDTAAARLDQIDRLKQAAAALEQLYGSGAVIFQAQQDIDRLTGQMETAVGQIQANPGLAQSTLAQVAQSMRAVQKQLDAARTGDDFALLEQLSRFAGSSAATADAAAGFADAVASGDQARAGSAAQTLESRLAAVGAGADRLMRWQAVYVMPRIQEADELQARQNELDQEAAALFQP